MGNLTNLFVSESYQGLLKLENSTTGVTGTLQDVTDGLGNPISMKVSSTDIVITGSFSGDGSGLTGITSTSASFADFAVTASYAINTDVVLPSGLISGSDQIIDLGFATTSSLDSISGSIAVTDLAQDGRLSSLETETGSLQSQINDKLDTSDFNTYTSSNDTKVNSLINATGSYASTASLNSLSQSIAVTDLAQDGRLNSLESTTSSLQNQINQKLDTGSFNTYSGNTLNVINAKLDTGSFNSYTSSNDIRVDSLEAKTGSYATTGSNVFQGTQTISGSLDVTGTITALSASITYLETIFQTSSIIFSSGSNILGDEPSDVQTLNGQVDIPLGNLNITGSTTSSLGFFGDLEGTASNAISSSHSINSDNSISSSFATNALSASYAPQDPLPSGLVSGSAQISYTGITDVPSGIVSSSAQVSYTGITDVPTGIVSGSAQIEDLGFATTGSLNDKLDTGSFNTYTSSNDSKVNSLINNTGSYITETQTGSFMTTGSVSGNVLTFTKANGSTFNLEVTVETGSLPSGLVSGSQQISYTGITDVPSGIISGSVQIEDLGFATTGSLTGFTTITDFNSYTSSNDTKVNDLISATSSYITSAQTGSMSVASASFADNSISSSHSVNSDTSISSSFAQTSISSSYSDFAVTASFALNSITVDTGSFATTGSNTFIGNQLINGDLNVTGALTASGLIYPIVDNGEKSYIQSDGNGNLSLQYVDTLLEPIRNGEATTLVKGTPVYVSGSLGANPIVFAADAGDPTKMPVIYIVNENILTNEVGNGILLGKIDGVNTTGYAPGTEIFVGVGGGWTQTRPTGSAIIQSLGIVTKEGMGGQGIVLNPGPANLPNLPTNELFIGDANSYPVPKTISEIGLATTGSNTFIGNQTITGSLFVSGSADNDLVINGRVLIFDNSFSQPRLIVSSSAGQSQIVDTSITIFSGSFNTTLNKNRIQLTEESKLISLSPNPSTYGFESLSGSTSPAIMALSGDGFPEAVIEFQYAGLYTDGTITMLKPVKFNSNVNITGSATITGSIFVSDGTNSGSVITNQTDNQSLPTVNYIVTLTESEYNTLSTGSLLNDNTLYVVSGSADPEFPDDYATTGSNTFIGNQTITGSLNVTAGVTGSFSGDGSGLTGVTAAAPDNVATTGSNTFIGNQTVTGSINMTGAIRNAATIIDCLSTVSASIDLSTNNSFIVLTDGTPAGLHLDFINHIEGQQTTLIIDSSAAQNLTRTGFRTAIGTNNFTSGDLSLLNAVHLFVGMSYNNIYYANFVRGSR